MHFIDLLLSTTYNLHVSFRFSIKGVQVSDHVIDWIRVFARAFFSGFQNAASNDQRLHNIFCWYKMADGADESALKDIKLHLSFNE